MKKTFHVYSARLQYNQYNELLGTVEAYDLKQVKEQIKKLPSEGGLNLNPFYSVIVDQEMGATLILHNEHMNFVTKKVVNS